MLRRRSINVYCPHNGVLCREEDLALSAVCSTCAQTHLDQNHVATSSDVKSSSKDLVDSSPVKLKLKKIVLALPPLPGPEHNETRTEE